MQIPPPPPSANRLISFYDTECFPNYWLLKLRPRGGVVYSYRLHAGQSFDAQQRAEILALFEAYTVISFNGNGYDVAMITGALMGYSCEELKVLNDRLIPKQIKGQPKVFGAKPWELGLAEWKPADHIDVMEVAPGAGSQKQYAGRIHCKTMRDLPYDPFHYLTEAEIVEVDEYCENDLAVLEALYDALAPQLRQRIFLNEKYGIDPRNPRLDLRSKSDAQVAETVLRVQCEKVLGHKIYPPEIPWNLTFHYRTPPFISFASPQLQEALRLVQESVFSIGVSGNVEMPQQLADLVIRIGQTSYKMGIGGLHSQEEKLCIVSNDTHQILMPDVASYYPTLMLNSGEFPPALGAAFGSAYGTIKSERLSDKALVKSLRKKGLEDTPEYDIAKVGDDGGKIMLNGTFGKTLSAWGILRAPQMGIQTTVTGQLSILMLIEWHEHYKIPVVSANTDGIVLYCPRELIPTSKFLIKEWEARTGLGMDIDEYRAIYARDVNTYIAIKTVDDVKRKGEFAKGGLVEKKNPDVEICADAAADFLAKGVPVAQTILTCQDIRKFVTIQKVAGGGVKMWGEGPRKGALVRDMAPTLIAQGWIKDGRKWYKPGHTQAVGAFELVEPRLSPGDAYRASFAPQTPEYLGKVVRWYYSTQAPGPIVYASNGNTVSLSYGVRPCMTLPDAFPTDIDYAWYIQKANAMLHDVGYYK